MGPALRGLGGLAAVPASGLVVEQAAVGATPGEGLVTDLHVADAGRVEGFVVTVGHVHAEVDDGESATEGDGSVEGDLLPLVHVGSSLGLGVAGHLAGASDEAGGEFGGTAELGGVRGGRDDRGVGEELLEYVLIFFTELVDHALWGAAVWGTVGGRMCVWAGQV